ncbi:pantothenate kinase [Nodosilinea sp. E11]|uniref:pantothenate kinase n=1 Tax=Nodosilinea sp. E11 TaxID=3037479 RepID=UPI002934AA51|nr:pantothenate kinase [Nodosilinea sp. E11]WOD37606.1 pantothenate kinase [Nodosilinea sp. E11]
MGLVQQSWLALIIGNSRWHWGAFEGDRWLGAWHTAPLTAAQVQQLQEGRFAIAVWWQLGINPALPADRPDSLWSPQTYPPLWMASVVASPVDWLADYPRLNRVETAQVPLQNTYPTLGVDRALALVGAGETWGWPVLVIDCGTALTFTAGVDQRLIGGAIVPGLRSQFRALHAHTDQLPALDLSADLTLDPWPQRWATNTAGAIASGVWHTQLASMGDFIAAWQADWPEGAIVLTGGDSTAFYQVLKQQSPKAQRIHHDPDLGFWGLRVCRRQQGENNPSL